MSTDKETVYALIRSDLRLFLRRVLNTVEPETKYEHAGYIEVIISELTKLLASPTRRLVINVPPRHLKSIIVSVAYSAWLLGHTPHLKLLCISYSPELATQFSKMVRLVMESAWYIATFPQSVLSASDNTQDLITTTVGGYRRAVSVGGAITGFGADVIIIDDPQKADDVQYPNKRQLSYETFKNTIATRLNDPKQGAIVLIQQRLHEEDWSGLALESGNWSHVRLPAIAEQAEVFDLGNNRTYRRKAGDVLHLTRLPKSDLDKIRGEIGDLAFETQYQQRPGCPGGHIIDLQWFRRFDQTPQKEPNDLMVQSWDIAYTTDGQSNFSVCTTWLYKAGNLHLIDIFRKKMLYPDLRDCVPAYAAIHKANYVVIEAIGPGKALYQELHRKDPFKYLSTEPKEPKGVRLMTLSHFVKNGRVWLPQEAPWLGDFINELRNFPNGKYDDQVDSFTQALRWLQYHERLRGAA
jgi:predicted phage terminase large subunit-like protein